MSGRNIAIVVFLLVCGILFYFMFIFRPLHWHQGLGQTAKQPYDLHFIKHLLENSPETNNFREVKRPLSKALSDIEEASDFYIAIGPGLKLGSEDIHRIGDFVHKGNDAFLSLRHFPNLLLGELIRLDDSLAMRPMVNRVITAGAEVRFSDLPEDQNPHIFYSNGQDFSLSEWLFFNDHVLNDTLIEATGYFDEYINMLVVHFGEGRFILHSTPMAFTNLHMSDPKVLQYVNLVLGQSKHRNIYWDVGNIISLEEAYRQDAGFDRTPMSSSRVMRDNQGPLYFILSVPAFRNAWYVLLIGSLLYLFFVAKRKQRPVPVISPLENTSLEYIKTIGEVYFRNSNSKHMAIHILHGFLRDFYKIYRFPWEPHNPQFIETLTKKSGLESDKVNKAVRYITSVDKTKFFSDEHLISLKQHMDTLLNIHKK